MKNVNLEWGRHQVWYDKFCRNCQYMQLSQVHISWVEFPWQHVTETLSTLLTVHLWSWRCPPVLLKFYAAAQLICLKFPKCIFFFCCCHFCICCFLCLKFVAPTYPVSAFQGQSEIFYTVKPSWHSFRQIGRLL